MKELFSNAGSVVTGLVSSTCCIGPAVFTGLGIGAGTTGFLGGLAGFLKGLIPYRPLFIGLALVFLGFSFYAAYSSGKKACATGDENSARQLKRQKIYLWVTSVVVLLLVLSPYWLGLI